MEPQDLKFDQVKIKICNIISAHTNATPEKVLSDAPFKSLSNDFDSLTYLEIQLLVEQAFAFEMDQDVMDDVHIPANLTSLTHAVMEGHARYHKLAKTE